MRAGDIIELDLPEPGALCVHSVSQVWLRKLTDKERTVDLQAGDVRRPLYEMRMGIAIMGYTNMTEEELREVNHCPFHEEYHDNYVVGRGNLMLDAWEDLAREMQQMSKTILEI